MLLAGGMLVALAGMALLSRPSAGTSYLTAIAIPTAILVGISWAARSASVCS